MSHCIEKLPHSCGSSDGLQVWENDDGSYSGYCFVCNTYEADPYNGAAPKHSKAKRYDPAELVAFFNTFKCWDVPSRGLKKQYLDYFGVKTGVDGETASVVQSVHFPLYENGNLVGYFNRQLEDKAKQSTITTSKAYEPFGWPQAVASGARRLFITEGQFDAVALYQIIKQNNLDPRYADSNPAVISISNGSGNAVKELSAMREKLARFETLVLVFDMDKPGQEAAQAVCKVFSNAVIAQLPCKDANECLLAGHSKQAFREVMFKATRPKNTRLVSGASLVDAARKQPEWGLSWPWENLTDATRGIRRGETIYFGAGVKMGKSDIVDEIANHLMLEHGKKILLAKPEQAMSKTFQRLVGKAASKIFHDPKIPFDFEAFDAASPLIRDKVIVVDNYQFLDWKQLRTDIIDAVTGDGIEDVFIDPITCLTNKVGSAEANELLTSVSADLSSMAKDYNFTAYIFCHLKAPDFGPPHEAGGRVLSTQFAGSRSMMRSCNYMIGIEGNKDPELPVEERNIRTLVLLEDREFGQTGRFPLYYNANTGRYSQL